MSDPFRRPTVLDMTPEGEFREPPRRPASRLDRLLARTGGLAALISIAAGGLLLAGIAVLLIGLLLPVVIGAGLVAAVSLWWRARRLRRQGVTAPRFVIIRR